MGVFACVFSFCRNAASAFVSFSHALFVLFQLFSLPFLIYTLTIYYIIVEAVTGILCRTSVGLNMHVSNSIFGCRIDLKWFREVYDEFTRSKPNKTCFWAKNSLFLVVLESYCSRISSKTLANLVSSVV